MRTILTLICLLTTTTAFAESLSGNQLSIQSALASGRPTLVDFGSSSCTPCKKMAPILDQLKKDYKGRANIIFVDIWENKKIGFTYRVQMIPTQVFFDAKGKEYRRHMGFMDSQSIMEILTKLGVK